MDNKLTKQELEFSKNALQCLKNDKNVVKRNIEEIKVINNKRRSKYNQQKIEVFYNYA